MSSSFIKREKEKTFRVSYTIRCKAILKRGFERRITSLIALRLSLKRRPRRPLRERNRREERRFFLSCACFERQRDNIIIKRGFTQRICGGEKPSIFKVRFLLLRVCCFILGLSLSVYTTYTHLERESESVISLVLFLGFGFSLFVCRSFPLKSRGRRIRERKEREKERINWRQH